MLHFVCESRESSRTTSVRRAGRRERKDPDRVGAFGEYAAFASAFVIGSHHSQAFSATKEVLRSELEPRLASQLSAGSKADEQSMVSLAETRPGVLVIRALGRASENIDWVLRALEVAVSLPEVLGENPLRRKY